MQFTLVVDGFGVKYVGKEHAMHLKKTIEEHYTVTTKWEGRRYIDITRDWNYKRRQVHLSMPTYVAKTLRQFKHELKRRQDVPFPSTPIKYGAKKQHATQEPTAPLLGKEGK